MKKQLFCSITMILLGFSNSTHAKQNVCSFDLLGKAGESYKMMEEWALAAKAWNIDIQLIPYQNEELANKDFKSGKCDAVYLTTMRSRQYNSFSGSIDAIGGVPTNAIAFKAIKFVLDKRNVKHLKKMTDGEELEIGGIGQIGPAYVFVNDRAIDSIEKVKAKKIAVLAYDKAQIAMVERLGAIPVPSDISNFVKKFNSGEVQLVGAPAYAFKALEMEKGLGSKGGIINFPALNVTANLVFRSKKFPATFGENSRSWFVKQLPRQFKMVKQFEEGIPTKYRINLSKADIEKYQKILQEGRINLTKQGFYDQTMMYVLKRSRCSVEPTNFECSSPTESSH